MRRYVVTMLILAFVVGILYQGAEQTGFRLLKMFGSLGVLLFGIVGTIALTKWQSREGIKEIEATLKSLEPESLLTDWSFQGGGRPDYLVVGPEGITSVCVSDVPQSARAKAAEARVAKGRERAKATIRWLRDRLNEAGPDLKAPLGELIHELPVHAVVVLSRRKSLEGYSADGIPVLNAEGLGEHICSRRTHELLDQQARLKLTRLFRST